MYLPNQGNWKWRCFWSWANECMQIIHKLQYIRSTKLITFGEQKLSIIMLFVLYFPSITDMN
jgi:hypothetical protein